jgi:hypothetical protein
MPSPATINLRAERPRRLDRRRGPSQVASRVFIASLACALVAALNRSTNPLTLLCPNDQIGQRAFGATVGWPGDQPARLPRHSESPINRNGLEREGPAGQ